MLNNSIFDKKFIARFIQDILQFNLGNHDYNIIFYADCEISSLMLLYNNDITEAKITFLQIKMVITV